MNISISYASSRGEVWRWYWRAWRQRLWRTHALVFLSTASLGYAYFFLGAPLGVAVMFKVAGLGLMAPIGFALYPLVRFKSQVRTLTVDDEGLATIIGAHESKTPWDAFGDVRDDGDTLVIQRRNLSAFIVPSRAFPTAAAREQFRDFVRAKILNDPRVF
jgi:YcxB-like protein